MRTDERFLVGMLIVVGILLGPGVLGALVAGLTMGGHCWWVALQRR